MPIRSREGEGVVRMMAAVVVLVLALMRFVTHVHTPSAGCGRIAA